MDEADRKFFARVDQSTQAPCWAWVGSRLPSGYGMFRPVAGGRKEYAHRWAHERWVGPIPAGWQVDHLCRNTWCANPAHLEAVTGRTNVRRAMGWTLDGDGWSCGRGHHLGAEPEGACPTCWRDGIDSWRAAHGRAKRTPGAQRRANEKYNAQTLRRFMAEHPEVPMSEIERLGLRKIQPRFRNGWTFADGHWYNRDGIEIGP